MRQPVVFWWEDDRGYRLGRVRLGCGTVDAMVSVRGLRKSYGAFEAVAGVDLEVERGEIFAFLGPNGGFALSSRNAGGPP